MQEGTTKEEWGKKILTNLRDDVLGRYLEGRKKILDSHHRETLAYINLVK